MPDKNLEKFNAYRYIARNYTEALEIINSKKLAFGEPGVVPYYNEDNEISLIFGIGSMNDSVEVFDNTEKQYKDEGDDIVCDTSIYGINIDLNERKKYYVVENDLVDDFKINIITPTNEKTSECSIFFNYISLPEGKEISFVTEDNVDILYDSTSDQLNHTEHSQVHIKYIGRVYHNKNYEGIIVTVRALQPILPN